MPDRSRTQTTRGAGPGETSRGADPGDDGERADSPPPFVSVVVPVYNDPEGIATTLDSLTELTYPDDRHEVLVVDNGSDDDTPAVVRRYADDRPNVKLLTEDRIQSSYAARNRGIESARGSVLAFIDADMSVDDDWLIAVVEALESADADALGTAVELYYPGGERTLAGEYNARTDLNVERYVEDLGFVPTCCLVLWRSVIEDVGRFDHGLVSSGDYDFGRRVRATGREFHFAGDVVVSHPARTALGELLDKAERRGRGRAQRHRRHPERYESSVRGLLHPGLYAPPLPSQLRRSVEGWDDLPAGRKAAFFAIKYLLRLTFVAGVLRELVRPSLETGADQRRSPPAAASWGGER